MKIKKLKIRNFKKFKDFELEFNEGVNVLVGDNDSGKSTILEAIHLALSGLFQGRYLRHELTQYIFNNDAVKEYLESFSKGVVLPLPCIVIELHFAGEDLPIFEGKRNLDLVDSCGLTFKVLFDERYKDEYEAFVKKKPSSLPIEYYTVEWEAFSQESITTRSIPIKSAFIDSQGSRWQNGSDVYVSRIIRENLEHQEIVSVSQVHREMRDSFTNSDVITELNKKVSQSSKLINRNIELTVESLAKNAWENSLITMVDSVPFHFIGKGEQCIVKTKLALGHKKSKEASVILIEEPENHLTHANLNRLIHDIKNEHTNKQVILSTHSSFVANKMNLKNLIILGQGKTIKLTSLREDTFKFFEKIHGYDTLRFVLCDKAILVEGPSDELVVQKAYLMKHGKLPIEDGVDVISVKLTFLRFLEIAKVIGGSTVVVTDNDGDLDAIKRKYRDFEAYPNIRLCYHQKVYEAQPYKDKSYSGNTLEYLMILSNGVDKISDILGESFSGDKELNAYMQKNKTECALKVFEYSEDVIFPDYICEAISK